MKLFTLISLTIFATLAAAIPYGESICHQEDYTCYKVNKVDTWDDLFPDAETKDFVQRVNRMNLPLQRDMVIAIPKMLERLTIYDIAPFPRYIEGIGEKTIYVDQVKLAFAAYDELGELVWWGPISRGVTTCMAPGGCKTPVGIFRIIRKQGEDCVSTAFPVNEDGEDGGALMPYCMHFFRGYALHGSEQLPGYNASHGCVRLFTDDARWLNEEFVDLPGGGIDGTRVIIKG